MADTLTVVVHRRRDLPHWGVLRLADDVFLPARIHGRRIINDYTNADDTEEQNEDYTLSICATLEGAWREVDRLRGLIQDAVNARFENEEA